MSIQKRQPAGQPVGGQFATTVRAESTVALVKDPLSGVRARFEWADSDTLEQIVAGDYQRLDAEPPAGWEDDYADGEPIPCVHCGGILEQDWAGIPGKWGHAGDGEDECWTPVLAARTALSAEAEAAEAQSAESADMHARRVFELTCAARELARDPKGADRINGTFDVLDEMVRVHDGMATAEEVRTLIDTHRSINEGAWGDLNTQARRALWTEIDNQAAADAVDNGLDGSDPSIARPLDSILESRAAELRSENRGAARSDAILILLEAGKAVANRHLVGDPRFPGWTQEAYEHMVRPYQTAFKRVHPADAESPASWASRPA